ncbi:MAG: hypothetical protein JO325_03150 [Solirubrobacterales bacterium]|nr:hypothetical protein [Solirubrobacterales bacterium]
MQYLRYMGQTDRRHSQWDVWTFRLIVIAFLVLAAVRPPTDAVLNLGMAILGAGGLVVLAPGLAARWLGDEASAPRPKTPRRGAWTLFQVGLAVTTLVLIIEGSVSWAFKPLLVPLFVLWTFATVLYGWQDLVALWRALRLH